MSGQILAVADSQGAQPVANSVAGSPFTLVAATPQSTPELRTRAVMVLCTLATNVRFNAPGVAPGNADANDMLLAPNVNHVFAVVGGTKISMFAAATTPVIYVEECREFGG